MACDTESSSLMFDCTIFFIFNNMFAILRAQKSKIKDEQMKWSRVKMLLLVSTVTYEWIFFLPFEFWKISEGIFRRCCCFLAARYILFFCVILKISELQKWPTCPRDRSGNSIFQKEKWKNEEKGWKLVKRDDELQWEGLS